MGKYLNYKEIVGREGCNKSIQCSNHNVTLQIVAYVEFKNTFQCDKQRDTRDIWLCC